MHRWSPDGQKVAVSDGNDIFVVLLDDPAVAVPDFGPLSAVAAFSVVVFAIRVRRRL
jgi:hypothetical protein